MSSGADCHFVEKKPGEWHYAIQRYPYGATEDYDRHGPFDTYQEAQDHLDSNYQNPGGWSERRHPDHVHNVSPVRPRHYDPEWDDDVWIRPCCGEEFTGEDAEAPRRVTSQTLTKPKSMTKSEAMKWIKRARKDLREFEAILTTPGDGWLSNADAYELLNDTIGSAAAIQERLEQR